MGISGTMDGMSGRTVRDFGPTCLPWPSEAKSGELQGFARVVRDFSKRHAVEQKIQRDGMFPFNERAKESDHRGRDFR